jgi:preprotein translocase subunit SecY
MDISSSYVPVKINPAGVLPVMFADSMMVVPAIIMKLLGSWFNIQPGLLSDIIMLILKSILILFFCIFCLSFTMNPEDISDNLRSRNACVPYVYEGSRTSRFFEVILNRISAIGCIYMCFVAATPELLTILVPSLKGGIISGTSLLILIGISLEIYSRMAPEPRK